MQFVCYGCLFIQVIILFSFQTVTLSSGVIIMLVSFVVVYFINSNANIIFSQQGPSTYYWEMPQSTYMDREM